MMVGMTRPEEALGMCAIVSDRVARRHNLQLIRVTGRTYTKREHWAVIDWNDDACDGEVIDLTARQYDASMPPTWRAPLDDWLDRVCEWLADGLTYEVYAHPDSRVILYSDLWVREDIDPDTALPRNDGLLALLMRNRVT